MQKFKIRETFETVIDCGYRFETPFGGKITVVQTGKRGKDVRKRHATAKHTKPHRA